MLFNLFIKLFIGGDYMVDLYVALIVKGRRKFENVPPHLQAAVKADLEALDLDIDGKPLL